MEDYDVCQIEDATWPSSRLTALRDAFDKRRKYFSRHEQREFEQLFKLADLKAHIDTRMFYLLVEASAHLHDYGFITHEEYVFLRADTGDLPTLYNMNGLVKRVEMLEERLVEHGISPE